jgi:hypothetical protein
MHVKCTSIYTLFSMIYEYLMYQNFGMSQFYLHSDLKVRQPQLLGISI